MAYPNKNFFESNKYEKNNPVYSNSTDYNNPKESFKFVVDIIKKRHNEKSLSILDVGCASGAFLFFAKNNLKIRASAGIDISDLHLKIAQKNVQGTDFFVEDIQNLKHINGSKFDVVTCLGTLSIFDDIELVLYNLLNLVDNGGSLYIYDLINEYPIDVIMRYRLSEEENDSDWLSGFNVRSKNTYQIIINKIENKSKLTFFPFSMSITIPKTSNPLRAWTINTEDNNHQIIVGTMQFLNFMCLEVNKQ